MSMKRQKRLVIGCAVMCMLSLLFTMWYYWTSPEVWATVGTAFWAGLAMGDLTTTYWWKNTIRHMSREELIVTQNSIKKEIDNE